MKVTAEICLVPIGTDVSLSPYITACVRALEEAGLNPQLHAYGTNIEGTWDEVFDALRSCHEIVHRMGAPRILTTLKVGTRTDREQSCQEKIDSVSVKLADS
ncbi:MAG: MTH1187 family thiamine-binding protein [Pseudomonadota bacterium]|nr:MTH1187 family thiamine-binding protein [Pseudomonadota bacterium]